VVKVKDKLEKDISIVQTEEDIAKVQMKEENMVNNMKFLIVNTIMAHKL